MLRMISAHAENWYIAVNLHGQNAKNVAMAGLVHQLQTRPLIVTC